MRRALRRPARLGAWAGSRIRSCSSSTEHGDGRLRLCLVRPWLNINSRFLWAPLPCSALIAWKISATSVFDMAPPGQGRPPLPCSPLPPPAAAGSSSLPPGAARSSGAQLCSEGSVCRLALGVPRAPPGPPCYIKPRSDVETDDSAPVANQWGYGTACRPNRATPADSRLCDQRVSERLIDSLVPRAQALSRTRAAVNPQAQPLPATGVECFSLPPSSIVRCCRPEHPAPGTNGANRRVIRESRPCGC